MTGQKIENIPNTTGEVVPNIGGTTEIVETGVTNSTVTPTNKTILDPESGNNVSDIQVIRKQDSDIKTVKEPENYGPNGSGHFRGARRLRGELGTGYPL